MISVKVTCNAPTVSSARWWAYTDLPAAKARLRLAKQYQVDFDRLEDEIVNLRSSRDWLASNIDEVTAPLLISYVRTLAPYLQQRGLGAELLQWCEDALTACRVIDGECSWLLLLRGEAQILIGQWREAVASVQEAIEASEDVDRETYAQATLALGRLESIQGDYQAALKTLARAEELLLEQSDYESVATARSEVAAYHLNRRELDQALSLYLEAGALRERAGAAELSDHLLLMLGVVYRKKEEYDQSARYLQMLLNRAETRGNQRAVATAAHHLAWMHLNQGQVARARQLCGRAIALYERIGDIRGASDAYEQLGMILLAEGEIEAAISNLNQSLTVRRQLGNRHGEASSLRHLSVAYLRLGRIIPAGRVLWKSLILYGKLGMITRKRIASMGRELLSWMVRRDTWTI